jgi:hypothetical protein
MTNHQTDHTALTRRLNDMARSQPEIANASWVMTRGVKQALCVSRSQLVDADFFSIWRRECD